jgi:hypothetical protein
MIIVFGQKLSQIGVIRLNPKKIPNSHEFLSILLNSHHDFGRIYVNSGDFARICYLLAALLIKNQKTKPQFLGKTENSPNGTKIG